MKRNLLVLCVIAGLSVVGCGDGLSGKYEAVDSNGAVALEFKDGKAYFTMMGMTTEGTYEVKDDKLILKAPDAKDGNLVMTIEKDGTLSGGPLGMKLKKKS